MKVLQAINLIAEGPTAVTFGDSQRVSIDGMQAWIRYKGDAVVLVVAGTNEWRDWFRFNFNLRPTVREGDTLRWHAGFLKYAQLAYSFGKPFQPDVVIGHSLGGAAAQVVGYSMKIPFIGFASPKPLFLRQTDIWPSVSGMNICSNRDRISRVPRGWFRRGKFYHVGRVHRLEVPWSFGFEHSVEDYIEALSQPEHKAIAQLDYGAI